jgi:hypothetical protein
MIKTGSLIRAIAAAEAGGGLTLLILPRLFVRLLLGVDVTRSGVVISRLFGLTLLSFGLACWPDRQMPNVSQEGTRFASFSYTTGCQQRTWGT